MIPRTKYQLHSAVVVREDQEADLSDPDDMWVDGAGSGWRAVGARSKGREYQPLELFNTTLLTVRAASTYIQMSIINALGTV